MNRRSAGKPPPSQWAPIAIDIKVANASPPRAIVWDVFPSIDLGISGRDMKVRTAARISSSRNSASAPNMTGGVR
jgi:hypothetical protein